MRVLNIVLMAGEWPQRGVKPESRRTGDLGGACQETERTQWRGAACDAGLGLGVAR